MGNLLRTDRIKRAAAATWMNLLVGGVVLTAALLADGPTTVSDPSWGGRAVTVFAIWVLSFVPGWLYVRFLGLRADALWNEYVLNLYRLGVDAPECLPPPPVESGYVRLPGARRGGTERANIYRQKFNAYYGRHVSAGQGGSGGFRVSVETLFPVFLCTATLAVAWTAVLWDPAVVLSPLEPWAALEFGFLGAYLFAVSMLVRRFYQSDLRPSAYAAVVLRIVVVLLTVAALHQLFRLERSDGSLTRASEYVTAFVVGFFPLAGLQALQRVAAKALGSVVPQLAPVYPLDQLDGLSVWYEARLVEEGVEDMQNLTTMNLVDVILHTRAPVGRLIDWLDQAFLLIHLDPASEVDGHPGAGTRPALRRLGIRTATDLVRAFGGADGTAGAALPPEALRARGLDPEQIDTLVRLLAGEPGLNPVWNWKAGGAPRGQAPAVDRAASDGRGSAGRAAVRHRPSARTVTG